MAVCCNVAVRLVDSHKGCRSDYLQLREHRQHDLPLLRTICREILDFVGQLNLHMKDRACAHSATEVGVLHDFQIV